MYKSKIKKMADLQNKSLIIRSAKSGKHNFTPICNELLQSNTLSLEAKGLISYILSLPENWTILKEVIRDKTGIGKTKFERIWKECKDAGYIVSDKMKNEKQQFTGWFHEVSDVKIIRHSENLIVGECGDIEKKDTTKETDINTELIKTALSVYTEQIFTKRIEDIDFDKLIEDIKNA